jgi:hypothetical protein
MNLYHNHVKINHHQGDNRIKRYRVDSFFSKGKFGSNILSQIQSNLEELAQDKGMFNLE